MGCLVGLLLTLTACASSTKNHDEDEVIRAQQEYLRFHTDPRLLEMAEQNLRQRNLAQAELAADPAGASNVPRRPLRR